MNADKHWMPIRQPSPLVAPLQMQEQQARTELEMFYRLTVDEAVLQLAHLLHPR